MIGYIVVLVNGENVQYLKKTSPNMSFKFSLISLAKKKFFKIEIVEVLLAVYHVTRKT
jgi:hypothetical protein